MIQQIHSIVALVIAVLILSVGLSAAESNAEPEVAAGTEEPKLQIVSATKERFEINFFSPTTGIHVLSQVHSDGELVRVSITTMDGETLFAVDRPVDSSQSLLTIVGTEFLVTNETLDNGETKVTEYAIPERYSLQIKSTMKRRVLPKSLLRHLDRENVNSSGRTAMDNFLMRPEVQLIESAVLALGNTELYGYKYPSAMAFYATALRLTNFLDEHGDRDETGGDIEINERGRYDRQIRRYCSNSRSYCTNCPRGSSCLGLCGRRCSCWWIVCRDCCYNIGCYLHDVYGCSGSSFWCWVTAPVGLVCTRGY